MRLIIQRINEKYKNINWEILSEENVKKTIIKLQYKFRLAMGFRSFRWNKRFYSRDKIMQCI